MVNRPSRNGAAYTHESNSSKESGRPVERGTRAPREVAAGPAWSKVRAGIEATRCGARA
jgi:hypothetical protein